MTTISDSGDTKLYLVTAYYLDSHFDFKLHFDYTDCRLQFFEV